MNGIELTNILIGLLIAVIAYVWQRFEKRMDKFEDTVQTILLEDVRAGKDIESIQKVQENHEHRITELEKKE